MGYYTNYTLEINADDSEKESLDELLNSEDFCDYSPLQLFIDGEADSCKWYEYDQDMLRLSEMFPKTLFILHGIGEEYDDVWKHYFKNGKSKYISARLVFDDFNESELV